MEIRFCDCVITDQLNYAITKLVIVGDELDSNGKILLLLPLPGTIPIRTLRRGGGDKRATDQIL